MIDIVEGNAAADLRRWCEAKTKEFLEAIDVVTTDLTESYRAGLAAP